MITCRSQLSSHRLVVNTYRLSCPRKSRRTPTTKNDSVFITFFNVALQHIACVTPLFQHAKFQSLFRHSLQTAIYATRTLCPIPAIQLPRSVCHESMARGRWRGTESRRESANEICREHHHNNDGTLLMSLKSLKLKPLSVRGSGPRGRW